MKRVFLAVLIAAAAVILVQAGENGRRDVSITNNDDSTSDDCSQHLQVHQSDFKSLVRASRDATVDMDVHNGGISVRRFTGTAKAEARNGGISLKQSTGKLTVHAQNGGITIQDCGGDVDARVENGGLSLKLPERWEGKGLEAHTQNGGLVVDVPRNLASGLEVSGSEHVSIICKGDICDNGQRTWDNSQRIFHFGSGSTQIRATTVNGGIVIRDRSKDTI